MFKDDISEEILIELSDLEDFLGSKGKDGKLLLENIKINTKRYLE
jgi:hypothetical protein